MRFYIADPRPGQDLDAIEPLSVRARSWLARVATRETNVNTISVVGAITMLEGLDYHYSKFMDLVSRLSPYYTRTMADEPWIGRDQVENYPSPLLPTLREIADLDALDHEAVAYLNRLGQFFAHARAQGFDSQLHKARQLMPFRNKHTAHRSIDSPRNETMKEQESQAMAFGFYRYIRAGFPAYQIASDRKHHDFHMRRDHPLVMQESLDAIIANYSSK
jgi:hypothetical protein